MDHTRPELKYVDARELNGTAARLDGVPVIGTDGDTLGKVEGFIIDVRNRRPRHVVVGAGWFIHKHFLVPIGHVRMNEGDTELHAEVAKSQVENSRGFNKSEFQKLTSEDATRLDEMVAAATGAGRTDSVDSDRMPQGWT